MEQGTASSSVAVSYRSEAVTARNTSVLEQDPEAPLQNLPYRSPAVQIPGQGNYAHG